jgi:Family of unknown function (DUF6932)
VIPPFNERGNLPPGVHKADWNELEAAFGGSSRRVALLEGLRRALDSLRGAGCRTAYVDGSFVTAKEDPADFDACWDAVGVDPDALDPVLLDFSGRRKAQKERFGGELFPADTAAEPAGTRFLDYFQRDRDTGDPKGIVEIDLEDLA